MGGVAGRESVKVVGHVELPLPIVGEEAPILVDTSPKNATSSTVVST